MIIISTQCFPPIIGGIENLVYNLALHLSIHGYDVIVFADASKCDDHAFDREQPFQIRRFSGWKPLRRRRKARAIHHLLKQGQCTALITDSWKSLELIRTGFNVPRLCLAHGTEFPSHPNNVKLQRIKRALSKASTIVANSNYTASRLSLFVENQNRINVIYPGICRFTDPPEEIINPIKTRLSGHKPVLISVGRIEKRKGMDTVLRVLPELLQDFPGLIYVIIGSGSQKDELQALASALGLSNHVFFLGFQNMDARNSWLKCSDVFILPVRQEKDDVEGFGMVFTEAAVFGIPAVAGNSGGAREAVIHKETGLVCDGNDPVSVASAIRQLLENETLRKSLGENARQRAESLLWDNTIKEYIRLLGQENA